MDNVNVIIPFSEKISLPQQLFDNLPSGESDDLQKQLTEVYFNDNPKKLQEIVDVSEQDDDLLELKKEQVVNDVLNNEYGFDVDILRERKNDKIADILVQKTDEYNEQVSAISK